MNYQFVKHQNTSSVLNTGRMIPVSKILADNVTRLIEGLAERPARPILAARMGIGDKTLGFIRAGSGNPTLDSIESVARFLRVQPWELLKPPGEKAEVQAVSQPEGFDDATMAQALEFIYLLASARPEDPRLRRPSWPMVLIAAKALTMARGDREAAMSWFLQELSKET